MAEPTLQIFCNINTTDPLAELGLEIRLDNHLIFDLDHVDGPQGFTHTIPDNDAEHVLEFVMKNKTSAHTQVDTQGYIINDARLIISDLSFDEIKLGQIFVDQAVYHHNFNGTQGPVEEKFYGEMGCNGRVVLKFTTPMYLWLLENM